MPEYSITVVQEDYKLQLQQAVNTVSVAASGPQGPPGPAGATGPPGAPGGSAYEYTQSAPAGTWIIDHNLNRKVHITLYNEDGDIVLSDVHHGSLNQTTVTWSQPTSGSAYIS